MTITELQSQRRTAEQSRQLGIDLGAAVLKTDGLKQLSPEELRALIRSKHPKASQSNLSSSEVNTMYDQLSIAENFVKTWW